MQARPTAALLLTCLLACCMPVVDGREFAPLDKATIASISAEMDKAKIADSKPVDDTGAGDKVAASDPAATDAKAPPAEAQAADAQPADDKPATGDAKPPAARRGLLAMFTSAPEAPAVAATAAAVAAEAKPSPPAAATEDDDGEISEADFVGEDEADPSKVAIPKEPIDDGLKHDFVNVYTSKPGAPTEKIPGLPGVEWNNDIILASRGPDGIDLFGGDNHPFAHLVPGMPREVVEAANGLLLAHNAINVSCIKPNLVGMVRRAEMHFGHRVIVTSGYRSPSHNRRVRGALHSQHLYCNALDLYMPGVDRDTLARYFYDMPDRGGLGLYCHTKSIHVDTGRRREWRWSCRRPG